MKIASTALVLASTITLTACSGGGDNNTPPVSDTPFSISDLLTTNADMAFAAYTDSVTTAQTLKTSLTTLINNPSAATLTAAKEAWIASREPYGQTEVYRFRNGPIDDDASTADADDGPEGQINAWPLSEGLIDYVSNIVDGESGTLPIGFSNNIIADTTLTINQDLLLNSFEAGGDESNVTTGYHAIEFLLWGQDLNQDLSGAGARDTSAGQRPHTDYATTDADCTSGTINTNDATICQRRGQYLTAAVDLLISDLQSVAEQWSPDISNNHRESFIAGGTNSVAIILEGMGRLSYGELAGERITIALLTDSQEDEHSCFSDNTHRDIFLNAKGVRNSFLGEYTRADGSTVISGTSINDYLIAEGHTVTATALNDSLVATEAAAQAISDSADAGTPFDNLIQDSNNALVLAVIQTLADQTDEIESAINMLGLTTNNLRQDTDQNLPTN